MRIMIIRDEWGWLWRLI